MAKTKTKTSNGNGAASNGTATMITTQRLGTILKSSRDIMRKDKGLSGDIDRIPVLTWIMFLKFLDDMESMREEEAKLSGKKFKPAIEPPYRWRDWAAKEDGITGDELIAFINQEECRRPDGSKGAGLFAYLRGLRGAEGGDRRDVIATVFKGTVNRMINGYLLRDVINKVNGIHFTSSEEIHTLGNFYESMLKEMRDAAGDSGEFYTPRAVVRFMVEVVDPKIGETVLDPACGTGGFLVEAFSHMEKQCKTVQQRRQLQQSSIFGNEAKPLPYLLAQMNLLLHGLETPRIEPGNSLAVALRELGDKDRMDVILTNPPFGGEEERGILSNFPEDKQTAETALLFLQLIMRKLRRAPKPGRAAVVVPNSVLSDGGVAARVREELLREFNLHTVLRLPAGVFAPYTAIPTNVLFFDRCNPTEETWIYAHPLPPGRKSYTKTYPLDPAEFRPCREWWNDRRETAQSCRIRFEDAVARSFNLDVWPAGADGDKEEDAGAVLDALEGDVRALASTFQRLADPLATLRRLVDDEVAHPRRRLRELLMLRELDVEVKPNEMYQFAGVYSFGGGVFQGGRKLGSDFAYKQLTRLRAGDFVYPKLMAWEGALGIVPPECDGCVVSPEFPVFEVQRDGVLPEVLDLYFRSPSVWPRLAGASSGTNARRRRLHPNAFLELEVPVPPRGTQELIRDVRAWSVTVDQLRSAVAEHLDASLRRLVGTR
ncbi:N-6 DNA methylase [Sorangium sp. So ce269]